MLIEIAGGVQAESLRESSQRFKGRADNSVLVFQGYQDFMANLPRASADQERRPLCHSVTFRDQDDGRLQAVLMAANRPVCAVDRKLANPAATPALDA